MNYEDDNFSSIISSTSQRLNKEFQINGNRSRPLPPRLRLPEKKKKPNKGKFDFLKSLRKPSIDKKKKEAIQNRIKEREKERNKRSRAEKNRDKRRKKGGKKKKRKMKEEEKKKLKGSDKKKEKRRKKKDKKEKRKKEKDDKKRLKEIEKRKKRREKSEKKKREQRRKEQEKKRKEQEKRRSRNRRSESSSSNPSSSEQSNNQILQNNQNQNINPLPDKRDKPKKRGFFSKIFCCFCKKKKNDKKNENSNDRIIAQNQQVGRRNSLHNNNDYVNFSNISEREQSRPQQQNQRNRGHRTSIPSSNVRRQLPSRDTRRQPPSSNIGRQIPVIQNENLIDNLENNLRRERGQNFRIRNPRLPDPAQRNSIPNNRRRRPAIQRNNPPNNQFNPPRPHTSGNLSLLNRLNLAIQRSQNTPNPGMFRSETASNSRLGMNYDPSAMIIKNKKLSQKGLLPAQINSIPIIKFKKNKNGKNIDKDQMECPICLIPFEENEDLRLLFCFHRYHKDCAGDWLKKKSICPLCNFNYRSINQNYL